MKRISNLTIALEISIGLVFALLAVKDSLGADANRLESETNRVAGVSWSVPDSGLPVEQGTPFELGRATESSLLLPAPVSDANGETLENDVSGLDASASDVSGSGVATPGVSASGAAFSTAVSESQEYSVSQSVSESQSDSESVSESERMISVSESEWQRLMDDLAAVKREIADDKAQAKLKKEEDELKKYRTPSWKLNGVMILDGAFSEHDDGAERAIGNDGKSGTKVRQARLDFSGSMFDMIKYRFTYEFSNQTTKDCWIGLFNTPNGVDMKVGHMKEPWSGEELTQGSSSAFIEKSFMNDLRGIHGGRNNGILFSNWSKADRFSWAAGVFAASMKEDDLSCVGTDENYAFTGRITYLPYYEENSIGQKFLLHLGLSYSYRKYDQENAEKLGTKCSFLTNSQIAANSLTTGTMTGLDSMNAFGLEAFWVRGPLSMDFEQGFFCMEDDLAGSVCLPAGYFQVMYSLTGESRNYAKDGGRYKRLKPNNPFIRTCRDGVGVCTGPGAWEIGFMCTWVDASELASGYATEAYHAGLLGKSLMNIWGLNWYLNENCRLMFNYALVHTDYSGFNAKGVNVDGTDGWEHVFGTRFQVTF